MALSADCTIYVRLLGEGTEVYRPVSAVRDDGMYYLIAPDGYDANDECWEFPPGSKVLCRETLVGGKVVCVASQLAGIES